MYMEKNIKLLLQKSLADIPEREVDFWSFPCLPKGSIVIFAGEGGTCKSTLWCSIAADISAGRKPIISKANPEASHNASPNLEPQKVLFFSSEDGIDTVIKRRLRIHGANFENIKGFGCEDPITREIRFDGSNLRMFISEFQPALCILDPIQSFLDPKLQMGSRNAMRQALSPLMELGKTYGTTFIIVAHCNKSRGTWGRSRVAESSDIWDIARSVLIFGQSANGIIYISHEKANYSEKGRTIEFCIDEEKVSFIGTNEKTDRDYVLSRDFNTMEKKQARDARLNARNLIQEQLAAASPDYALPESELKKIVVDRSHIALRAYKEAKSSLLKDGAIQIRPRGFQGTYYCMLTAASISAMTQSDTPPQD